MATLNFKARNELRSWLRNQSTNWGQIIASRAAMRSFPYLDHAKDEWLRDCGLAPFRALLISWLANNAPNLLLQTRAVAAAANAADRAAKTKSYSGSISSTLATDSMYLAALSADNGTPDNVVQAVKSSAEAAANFVHLEHPDVDRLDFAAEFPDDPAGHILKQMWQAVSDDCNWLNRAREHKYAAQQLSLIELWSVEPLYRWMGDWWHLSSRLLNIDPNYSVWIDWYERRIQGERAAFDISGDKNLLENKKILRRLAEATDEDFWGKGHEYVNATLKGWLDEARARVAPPPIVAEASGVFEITGSSTAELGPLPTPPQDSSAIAYGVNEQGKLDRLPNSDQAHLRDVPDQRRAYDDLREAAAELLGEGQRLGHRLQRALDRFLHSLPDGFEDAEAYLVWRDANALRRLHRAHREAAKSPEPDEALLEPVVAEGLGGLLDLYNNFAFADDGLRAKDEARIAPQERASAEAEARAAIPLVQAMLANPEIATPDALDDIVADREDAELPAHDAYADQVLVQSNRTKRNIVAGLISDTWAAFKSTGVMGQAIAGGAAWDGIKLTATIIGGTDYAPLMQFIATNPGLLQHYVAVAFPAFEHLSELIDRIRLYWLTRSKN